MRKMFLIGVAAQIIIVIISLVLKNDEIIKYGNLILIAGTAFILRGGAVGANGWEYVGLSKKEKDNLNSTRSRLFIKILFFILPSLIVIGIYFMYNGFSI